MSEKVSTITLRLTAEEAAQLEILKDIIGKKSGSEAIKYVVKEYPRFCAHYKQEAREHGELKRNVRDCCPLLPPWHPLAASTGTTGASAGVCSRASRLEFAIRDFLFRHVRTVRAPPQVPGGKDCKGLGPLSALWDCVAFVRAPPPPLVAGVARQLWEQYCRLL